MANFHGGSTTGSGGRRSTMETEDLEEEEDIWSTINAREISSIPKTDKFFTSSSSRPIPRATAGGGDTGQLSALVNIPDKWSKTLKEKSGKNLWDDAYNAHDDEMSDDEEDMVPPHEYLARRLARTQIASFSMCEGVGRTLKGRDVTKFRNDVLTKTGFLE